MIGLSFHKSTPTENGGNAMRRTGKKENRLGKQAVVLITCDSVPTLTARSFLYCKQSEGHGWRLADLCKTDN